MKAILIVFTCMKPLVSLIQDNPSATAAASGSTFSGTTSFVAFFDYRRKNLATTNENQI